jgi:hypothetical protein
MDLNALFASIPDFRRGQGQRYKLSDVLWLVFLGIASGYQGYRGIAKFAKANAAYFREQFRLKHGVPSHVTFREILSNLDKEVFLAQLNHLLAQQDLPAGNWVSGDGKSLASTVSKAFEEGQDFAATVSLFAHASGVSCQIAQYRNKKVGEAQILRELLPSLQGKGVRVSLDALHLQKKQSRPWLSQAITI